MLGSGNLSQNVEINKSLNLSGSHVNFSHLYLLRYCDLSEQMGLDWKAMVLVLVFVMRFGLGMLSMHIHEMITNLHTSKSGNVRFGNFLIVSSIETRPSSIITRIILNVRLAVYETLGV